MLISIKNIPVLPEQPLHPLAERRMVGAAQVGILGQHPPGGVLGLVEQAHIPLQAGQLQLGQAVLAGAEEIPGTPHFQILFRDHKPVGGGAEGF